MVVPVDEQLGASMDLLDVVMGLGVGTLVYCVGALTGYLFRSCHQPPTPEENGFRSALALYKQTTDKAIGECAETRSFARDMVSRLLDQNDAYANKVLAVTDGALDRMRIEREDGPRPKVDPSRSLADTILLHTHHDAVIPNRSADNGSPMD